MTRRWRGPAAGLAIAALALVALAGLMGGDEAPVLEVRGPDGALLTSVPLPDERFTLRYRNSVYRSLAEEEYRIDPDGRIRLTSLAADEIAVLEEYYAIDEPAWPAAGGDRAWRASPARTVVIDRLTVAATDLGRRVLLVDGRPVLELWPLVDDRSPSVHLEVGRR